MNGSMVMLHCVMDGHPPPVITWYHNGAVVDEGRTLPNGTLIIVSALLSDAGVYRCVGNGSDGAITSPEEVMLRVYRECSLSPSPSLSLSLPLSLPPCHSPPSSSPHNHHTEPSSPAGHSAGGR